MSASVLTPCGACTRARSVAKLTLASTPSSLLSRRSTRVAHDAQVGRRSRRTAGDVADQLIVVRDRGAVERDDDVVRAQTRARRGRRHRDVLHERAMMNGQLERLLEMKLASGLSAPHRLRDLADVLEVIRVRHLDAAFGDRLAPSVREKYRELHLAASEAPDDVP